MVLPFGLTNAPVTFVSLMNMVYQYYLDKFIIMFTDDILVYFNNEHDHEIHLRRALQVLRDNMLSSKFSKCEFWLKDVNFLGHIISKKGVSIDPTKIQAAIK